MMKSPCRCCSSLGIQFVLFCYSAPLLSLVISFLAPSRLFHEKEEFVLRFGLELGDPSLLPPPPLSSLSDKQREILLGAGRRGSFSTHWSMGGRSVESDAGA